MIVIDTSVWIAGLIPDDVHFHDTQPFLGWLRIGQVSLVVPAHFLAEVAGVLSRIGEPQDFINDVIDLIYSGEQFDIREISPRQGMHAAQIAKNGRVRGSDAIFLSLAHAFDLPLVSWDRQQRERGAIFCRTMTPIEAMAMSG